MKLPKGVVVRLLYVPDSDITSDCKVLDVEITEAIQYIDALAVGKATIDVEVDSSVANRIFGIAMDHKHGTVQLKRDLVKDPLMGLVVETGTKWYQTKVPVMDSKDFIPTTKYPQNYMALVELDADKPGLVRIWEVALVSQKGLFFVTTQCTYEAQCYLDSDGFKCPYFERVKPRHELVGLLRHLFLETMPSDIPSSDEWLPPADPQEPWPGQGIVLWWNCAMQYGVILTTEGVARIHWSNVKRFADGLICLEEGEIVNYEELGTPFQTYERETNLKLEAFGVRGVVLDSDGDVLAI